MRILALVNSSAHTSKTFIERDADSLSVPQLRDLPRLLALPPGKWPQVDLSVSSEDVRCDKASPTPGEHVKCEATIYNRGPLDAVAHLTTGLSVIGSDMGTNGRQVVQKVASNGRVVVAWEWVWPQYAGRVLLFGPALQRGASGISKSG